MSPDPGLTSAAILALLVLSAFAAALRAALWNASRTRLGELQKRGELFDKGKSARVVVELDRFRELVAQFGKSLSGAGKLREDVKALPDKQTKGIANALRDLLRDLMPRYRAQGRSYLNIAFGCTGGRHRSVYSAERAAEVLRDAGFSPTIQHRNLGSRPADPLERR